MLVGVVISLAIAIVVGVSHISDVVECVSVAKNTPNAPAGLNLMLDMLIYAFAAVIFLGAIAWLGGEA